MLTLAKSVVHAFGTRYIKKLCDAEYRGQKKTRKNERSIEYRFVFENLTELRPEKCLDVGSGTTALPHLIRNCGYLVTAVDNIVDYWPEGMVNRHFHVVHDDITRTRLSEKFDFITCISVLEHIKDHAGAMRSMLSLLNPGGHLVLTCPYSESEYIENCYDLAGSSYGKGSAYACQAFSRKELSHWIMAGSASIAKQEYWEFFTGKHWTVGEVLPHPRRVTATGSHQLTCVLIKKDA
jgi:2-polyprenyl-3-methyl-5-hydroxy-6-metoxy-1,4-benzoquinol methylase